MSTRSLGRGGAVARGWGPPVFHHQRRFVTVSTHGDTLLMVVKEGPQVHVMGFEIYALAIVNELYFRRLAQGTAHDVALTEGRARLQAKIALLRDYARTGPARRHPFEFFDFGVRRRFSVAWQEEVATTLAREVPKYL